jgi:hypothetical protein
LKNQRGVLCRILSPRLLVHHVLPGNIAVDVFAGFFTVAAAGVDFGLVVFFVFLFCFGIISQEYFADVFDAPPSLHCFGGNSTTRWIQSDDCDLHRQAGVLSGE